MSPNTSFLHISSLRKRIDSLFTRMTAYSDTAESLHIAKTNLSCYVVYKALIISFVERYLLSLWYSQHDFVSEAVYVTS